MPGKIRLFPHDPNYQQGTMSARVKKNRGGGYYYHRGGGMWTKIKSGEYKYSCTKTRRRLQCHQI